MQMVQLIERIETLGAVKVCDRPLAVGEITMSARRMRADLVAGHHGTNSDRQLDARFLCFARGGPGNAFGSAGGLTHP